MLTSIEIERVEEGTDDRVYDCYCRRCGNDWEQRLRSEDYGYRDGGYRWWGRFPEPSEIRNLVEDVHFDDSPECY